MSARAARNQRAISAPAAVAAVTRARDNQCHNWLSGDPFLKAVGRETSAFSFGVALMRSLGCPFSGRSNGELRARQFTPRHPEGLAIRNGCG